MEESRIIIKPVVAQQFEHSMKHGRIFFLSAPCGFGKTVVAEELLRGRKIRRMQAEKPDFERAETDPDWKILLVDDLQLMQEEEQRVAEEEQPITNTINMIAWSVACVMLGWIIAMIQ